MRNSLFWASVALFTATLTASAQTTNTDPLQTIKDSLGNGNDQQSVLQDVLGNAQNGKKVEKKLETPETVRPPDQKDITQKNIMPGRM